jgi:uncharacterized MAPEG superfamily protein
MDYPVARRNLDFYLLVDRVAFRFKKGRDETMTTELYWLTLTALMTALFWVPYVLNRVVVSGLGGALAGTAPEAGGHSLWAQRAIKAHYNAVENLAIFASAVLVAHVLNISNPATKAAVVVYFFARLLHYVVYSAGIPAARTLTFTAGWLAQIVIIASVLRWV